MTDLLLPNLPLALASESMSPMAARLALIAPEIVLFAGAVVVAVLGLARTASIRRSVPLVTVAFLALSIVASVVSYRSDAVGQAGLLMPWLGAYAKPLIASIGILLAMVAGASIDRRLEEAFDSGRAAFDAIRTMKGEFFAFFLLSIAGTMLIATTSDLIWLFLALELASLPTYVMVAVSRGSRRAQEAAVKYFFLGALSAATFLYGFALLYGATGTLELQGMQQAIAAQAMTTGVPTLAIIGGVLAVLGIGFKLAAVPMHFYAPDVYQGAPTPVTGFISFVPKVTGFAAIILLCAALGWSGHHVVDDAGIKVPIEGLPRPVHATLWVIAVLTMILGNIGALLQTSVKRLIAYSSIAHSGYMLVGVVAGTAGGIEAVLFYLATYGVANVAMFGALAGLERQGREIDAIEDLGGLWKNHPGLATMMAVAAFSMVGLPPLFGFWGKLDIVIAGITAGEVPLVVVMMATSAVSAYYYLQLAGIPVVRKPDARTETLVAGPSPWPRFAAMIFGLGVLLAPFGAARLMDAAASGLDGSWLAPTAAAAPTPATSDETASSVARAPGIDEETTSDEA